MKNKILLCSALLTLMVFMSACEATAAKSKELASIAGKNIALTQTPLVQPDFTEIYFDQEQPVNILAFINQSLIYSARVLTSETHTDITYYVYNISKQPSWVNCTTWN